MPSLPDRGEWDVYEAARRNMAQRLSRSVPAERYLVSKAHAA